MTATDTPLPRFTIKSLETFSESVLKAYGMTQDDACWMAAHIVYSEAFRRSSHGIIQLAVIRWAASDSAKGEVKQPQLVKDLPAAAVFDGKGCLGNLTMKAMREWAGKRCAETGMATASGIQTNWIACAGTHLIPLAEDDKLAVLWVEHSGDPRCAPFGGTTPIFSTNPMAYAFPAKPHPVVADFSTSALSNGRVGAMKGSGKVGEIDFFQTADGKPTNDPKVLEEGGSMLFTGGYKEGHKGFALSLLSEALSAMSGGPVQHLQQGGTQNVFLLVADIGRIGGLEHFNGEMAPLLERIRADKPRPGLDAVRLPGDRGFAALQDARDNGVPLDDHKLKMLSEIGEQYGVPFALHPL